MAFAAPLALAAGIIGTGVTAAGKVYEGLATANAAKFSAEVARNNAALAQVNADRAIDAGQQQAETESRKNAARVAGIKTAQAASGIDVNTGSAADVQAGERMTGQLDAETVLNNAQWTSFGYRSQATNFQNEASLDESKATSAQIGGDLGAFGSVLGNASSLGLKWAQLGNSGGGSTADADVTAGGGE
jgi:hypothetical protein